MVREKYHINGLKYSYSKYKPVRVANFYKVSFNELLKYTNANFGKAVADDLHNKAVKSLSSLPYRYTAYPECRFLPTTTRMYRTISVKNFAAILYRIKPTRIEVLSIYNKHIAPSRIRKMRSIKI